MSKEMLPGVECTAKECMYNVDGKMCTASKIQVKGQSSMCSAETACETFKKCCN